MLLAGKEADMGRFLLVLLVLCLVAISLHERFVSINILRDFQLSLTFQRRIRTKENNATLINQFERKANTCNQPKKAAASPLFTLSKVLKFTYIYFYFVSVKLSLWVAPGKAGIPAWRMSPRITWNVGSWGLDSRISWRPV